MTPEQEKQLLVMLEDWNRIGWLVVAIAKLAKWITIVVGGVSSVYVSYKFLIGGGGR